MKMIVDVAKEGLATKNLSILLDQHNMLTLPCLMPMLHFANSLVKLAHNPTCCGFYAWIKDIQR